MQKFEELIEAQALEIQKQKTKVAILESELEWEINMKHIWKEKFKDAFQILKKCEIAFHFIQKNDMDEEYGNKWVYNQAEILLEKIKELR